MPQSEERSGDIRAAAEGPGGARAHAGKPVEAGAADQMEENGLRLVIQCMTDRDAGAAAGNRLLAKEGVTKAASGVLERVVIAAGASPHVGGAGDEGDAECSGDFGQEAGIVLSLTAGAEHVIEMGSGEANIEVCAEAGEDDEKRGRVGAARYPHEDMLTGPKDRFLANMTQDAAFKGRGEAR